MRLTPRISRNPDPIAPWVLLDTPSSSSEAKTTKSARFTMSVVIAPFPSSRNHRGIRWWWVASIMAGPMIRLANSSKHRKWTAWRDLKRLSILCLRFIHMSCPLVTFSLISMRRRRRVRVLMNGLEDWKARWGSFLLKGMSITLLLYWKGNSIGRLLWMGIKNVIVTWFLSKDWHRLSDCSSWTVESVSDSDI